ncbi:MAG: 5-formyltetrahydrofolate cyclo-ligase [Mediterranea sp.]|nr:5-formyltetrahydrofolate cyclo-ligase [Mediterranea sp.]
MSFTTDAKRELRLEMARLKVLYLPEERKALSVDVSAALERHPLFGAARVVLLYHSLADEVDTSGLLARWLGRKRVLLPVVVDGAELELREYRGEERLATGRFGIEEPTGEAFTDYPAIDLAVVPGVAFDRQGHRLGRGKGYYDRLLPRLTQAYKLGLCFPFQLVERVPAEPSDVPMDEVVEIVISD